MAENYNYKEKHPPLEEVKYNGKTYPIKVNLWAIKTLKKESKEDNSITSLDPECVVLKFKLAIQSSLRDNKSEFDKITDELIENIIDETPSIFARIITNYSIASDRLFEVAKGNE